MTPAEVGRKGIHAGLSLGAAGAVWLLDPTTAAVVLAAATLVALVVELARRSSGGAARTFARLAPMLKEGETRRLTGATTLAIGFTTAAVLLPGTPALAGILFAGLGDPAAALAGRRWGRIRYPGGKSVVGSVVFLAVATAVGLLLGFPPAVALGVAGILTVVEAVALGVDDNLYLPVLGAAAVAAAGRMAGM